MAPGLIEADPNEVADIRALEHLIVSSKRLNVRFVIDGGKEQNIPPSLLSVLATAARELAQGRSVVILHYDQEITTQQAADLLQVSRPFLITLLEQGQIPYHRVGTHRRIRMRDVLAYKSRRDDERHAALSRMISASESLGLYDDGLPDQR